MSNRLHKYRILLHKDAINLSVNLIKYNEKEKRMQLSRFSLYLLFFNEQPKCEKNLEVKKNP